MTLTYTYAATRTRTEAVVDQFDIFLRYAGLTARQRDGILLAVENRWIIEAAVYLENRDNKRILEASVEIDWQRHSDHVLISPTIRTDLPGWERGAGPEIHVIGSRFGRKAQELGVKPRFWVRFTSEIHRNSVWYRQAAEQTGVVPGGRVPDWKSPPVGKTHTIQDLSEVSVSLREAQ